MASPQIRGPGGQPLQPGTLFAIGRNYAAHAAELGNAIPQSPVVFLKAWSSLAANGSAIPLPPGATSLHHEVELVVLIGKTLSRIAPEDALDAIAGYGVGIDFTDRALQSQLKAKGLPWVKSKSFRGAACLSDFIAAHQIPNPQDLTLRLWVNGEIKQDGHSGQMIYPVAQLLSYLSQSHDLLPGDLVFTGTPQGVGPVVAGDKVDIELVDHCRATFTVTA